MKTKILLLGMLLLTSGANATNCLNNNELVKLKDIYKGSSQFYSRVKLDCKSTNKNVQKICASPEQKMMAEIHLRTGVYDYENATGTELTGKAYKAEYNSHLKGISSKVSSCSDLKSDLIDLLSNSTWRD
ncbi:hypothetical protein [Acinetobacter bereziniae]|uniref:hypothetical protein n=1 Tax=Acinetobacter bereziniae TaxID=106648 RepID=UPI0018FF459B|nr:hypothetical protein [Acinetobacter bereziniae]MBJ8445912.1 hypothetical protein [Acinetobacter bereziniae]